MAADIGPRRLAFAIALLSAAALAYQLLLMRWLAIAHWHPFAVMIISLALLGHGASGTWLSVMHGRLVPRFAQVMPACALLFAISAVAVLGLVRRLPFNGLELVWNPRQLLWLGALYLTLALPFFFAASAFGLAFARYGTRIPALYAADLAGAGAGAVLAFVLAWRPVGQGLGLAAAAGALAGWLAAPRALRGVAAALVLALCAAAGWHGFAPPVNEYKGLSKALLLPGARIAGERDGPHGWLAVLESPQVPLRHVPGLSLGQLDEPPPQTGVFTDGDAMSVVTAGGAARPHAYLARTTSALPYALRPVRDVLVLGASGGQDVLQALVHGARRVDAVESDPQRLALVRDGLDGRGGEVLRDARVRTVVAEPRAFVRAAPRRYDLIVFAAGEAGGAGATATAEQYALTVEAVRDAYRRLAPGGLLAMTRATRQPPRDELKWVATLGAALRAEGVAAPAAHVAAIRNWDAGTWLMRRGPFTPSELARLRAFAEANGFDPAHYPGLARAEANRFHMLDRPELYDGAQALLSPRAEHYIEHYKFAIAPATDDRPYFGNFFRWRTLPELWRLREQGSAVLLDSGYLLLLATLLQVVPLALLLVLLPLRVLPRGAAGTAGPRWRAGAYFLALGLAFMLIEIAVLSRLTLLIGHPLVAVTAGLAGFLLCAGAGSAYAQGVSAPWQAATAEAQTVRLVRRAAVGIGVGLAWQFAVFGLASEHAAAWPLAARMLAGVIGIAPLAFAMGLPFALGLARLARTAPEFVPWAWGLNGCASVIAAVAALVLAMAIGLRATLLCALALYALAAWVWPARPA